MTISGGDTTTGDAAGGAIDDKGSGTLSVGADIFSGNKASGDGAAIDTADTCTGADASNLVVSNSTFVDNAGLSDGGAINAQDNCSTPSGTLTVTASTFQSNSAGFGGGVAGWTASTITNSTFVSNSDNGPGAGGAFGGQGTLVDDTFVGNTTEALTSTGGTAGISVANSILDDAPAGQDARAPSPTTATTWPPTTPAASARPASRTRRPSARSRLAANGSSGPQTAAITTSSSAHNLVPLERLHRHDRRARPATPGSRLPGRL